MGYPPYSGTDPPDREATINRADVEQAVTQAVIDRLESGVAPWTRPWATAGFAPTSLSTGKPYRGINTLLLTVEAETKGYSSPLWATYKQLQSLGGQVRRGEKSTVIVYWNVLRKEERDASGEATTKSIPLLRYYRVFNAEQADGVTIPDRFKVEREPVAVPDAVSSVLDGYADGPEVRHVPQGRAYYSPLADKVTLPVLEQFDAPEGYAETLFHELTHSTGHPDRCSRFSVTGNGPFGCEAYAEEELVAEMGAAMLAGRVGVDISLDNTAAYVGGWLSKLRDDRRLIITAAQRAQRAVDRILGEQPGTDTEREDSE